MLLEPCGARDGFAVSRWWVALVFSTDATTEAEAAAVAEDIAADVFPADDGVLFEQSVLAGMVGHPASPSSIILGQRDA